MVHKNVRRFNLKANQRHVNKKDTLFHLGIGRDCMFGHTGVHVLPSFGGGAMEDITRSIRCFLKGNLEI